ncbi:type VI secretion system TssO [Mariniflexile ostreae]|uniref:Type VI secretion system TssO n=1 Tax=Mariniflexile ostreae TaxID=1520892 RepID=A0ABV5FA54_9FLAO
MKPLNYVKRRKQILIFSLYFSFLLIILFLCSFLTLSTASKGISLLNEKKNSYDAVFHKQAELNFQLEDIYKNLNNLRSKRRTLVEHREMQKLISDTRIMLENDIGNNAQSKQYYTLYEALFAHLKEIQSIMDVYETEENRRIHNIDQLEKCKQKYKEINNNKYN